MTGDTGTDTARPKYMQVMDTIREGVLSGVYPPGARLPGRRRLATQLGVAPMTVGNALREYSRLGVLDLRAADGAFVTDQAPTILSQQAVEFGGLAGLPEVVAQLAERVRALETEVAQLRDCGPEIPTPR